MNWSEELPESCPPKEAVKPEDKTVYRLSISGNSVEEEYKSQRSICPSCTFKNVSECITRSLSVYDDLNKCQQLQKLPRFKKRWKGILELKLNSTDGMIQQTFKKSHFSWWRAQEFDISTANIV